MTVLYFAWLRERTGSAREQVTVPEAVGTAGDLIAWLRDRSPGHASAFANPRVIRCAINQEFADAATKLRPGDEVALFPPVTGG
ncbi:MAG: molybdopterin converting factor subunit 1 [Acetobacteraceae bacterium]|nr:molybdopterin converting factor subunit 1 [Acetobacteraceae bacterium]MBV8525704.1 molybdopterin converting factor subunit 1 [Acetobacteraceae bacterium]MBV8591692.1 molybdopterin converting factor subunit 1 [Acetobacteraceae bacterium]